MEGGATFCALWHSFRCFVLAQKLDTRANRYGVDFYAKR